MEKDIEKAGCKHAEKLGFIVRKYKTPGRRNAPDRIHFAPGGVCFFIEYKDTGEKPRTGQVREANKLRALGFDVHFVDNVPQAKEVISQYANP